MIDVPRRPIIAERCSIIAGYRGLLNPGLVLLVLLVVVQFPGPTTATPLQTPEAGFAINPDELVRLESQLMAAVELNRSVHCFRPVLQGEPLPASADEDMLTLLGGTEAYSTCQALFGEDNDLFEWQINPRGNPPPLVVLTTWLCEPLADMVSQTVRHRDACSPFLVGRGVGSPDLNTGIRLMRSSKGAVLVAQDLARQGRKLDAWALLRDTARLAQDFSRGDGTPIVNWLMGAATIQLTVDLGVRHFLETGAFAQSELETIVDDLSDLIETEQPLSDVLSGEREGIALQWYLPLLKPEEWIPIGGADPLFREKDGRISGHGRFDADYWAREWIIQDEVFRRFSEVCDPGVSPSACIESLRRLVSEAKAMLVLLGHDTSESCCPMRSPLLSPLLSRETLVLRGIACFNYLDYIEKVQAELFYLRAARIHAQLLLTRQILARDPSVEEFRALLKPEFLVDPLTSNTLVIVEEAPGLWLVRTFSFSELSPYRFAVATQ